MGQWVWFLGEVLLWNRVGHLGFVGGQCVLFQKKELCRVGSSALLNRLHFALAVVALVVVALAVVAWVGVVVVGGSLDVVSLSVVTCLFVVLAVALSVTALSCLRWFCRRLR